MQYVLKRDEEIADFRIGTHAAHHAFFYADILYGS